MLAYILRRLALILPTLFGIMLINFVLVQFVPGGPIEQILAQLEQETDVFEGIAGGGGEYASQASAATISARRDYRRILSPILNASSALTSRQVNVSCT